MHLFTSAVNQISGIKPAAEFSLKGINETYLAHCNSELSVISLSNCGNLIGFKYLVIQHRSPLMLVTKDVNRLCG